MMVSWCGVVRAGGRMRRGGKERRGEESLVREDRQLKGSSPRCRREEVEDEDLPRADDGVGDGFWGQGQKTRRFPADLGWRRLLGGDPPRQHSPEEKKKIHRKGDENWNPWPIGA
jgi:hypothetical protein